MKFDKIKEMLKGKNIKNINFKDKKVQTISGAVAGALIIAVAGTMILNNKSVENKNLAIEKNIEDKSSEDNKVKLAVENTDNTIEDKEIVINSEEHVHDENCNHDNENSTSQEESITENNSNKSNVENIADNKESNSSSSNSTSNSTSNNNINNSNSNKNENNTSNNNSNKNEHTHTWVEVYKDVSHAEEGHWENVLVKDAWTESVPVYKEQEIYICNGCGADITSDPDSHMYEALLSGNTKCAGYHSEWKQVQVGTNTIKHDAVYEKKWIVDKAAWTEKVLSGYKCSSCGATK